MSDKNSEHGSVENIPVLCQRDKTDTVKFQVTNLMLDASCDKGLVYSTISLFTS